MKLKGGTIDSRLLYSTIYTIFILQKVMIMQSNSFDQKILKDYYKLWKKGLGDDEIQFQLQMPEKEFIRYTPAFLTYCSHHSAFDARQALHISSDKNLPELTDERRVQFLEYISLGLSYDKAALMMNIPLVTVMNFWFKMDDVFRIECKMAAEKQLADIELAMFKRARGFNTAIKTTTDTEGVSAKEGKFSSSTTSETEKYVSGDVNAQKFIMTNKKPDTYSLDGEVNREGNKGRILEAIEDIVQDDENDLDSIYKEDEPK